MNFFKFSLLLALAILMGCAHKEQLRVEVDSDPSGATIYTKTGDPQHYEKKGQTPVVWYYDLNEEKKRGGTFSAAGIKLVWASGAEIEVPHMVFDLGKGLSQKYSVSRPADAEGREIDAKFALDLETARKIQSLAQAQRDRLEEQQEEQRRAEAMQQYQATMDQIRANMQSQVTQSQLRLQQEADMVRQYQSNQKMLLEQQLLKQQLQTAPHY